MEYLNIRFENSSYTYICIYLVIILHYYYILFSLFPYIGHKVSYYCYQRDKVWPPMEPHSPLQKKRLPSKPPTLRREYSTGQFLVVSCFTLTNTLSKSKMDLTKATKRQSKTFKTNFLFLRHSFYRSTILEKFPMPDSSTPEMYPYAKLQSLAQALLFHDLCACISNSVY